VPVKDSDKPYLAMEWGGTAISPATPVDMLKAYVSSAVRFQDLAVGTGADVIITNHTAFDGIVTKLEALKSRKSGDSNPYVVGKDSVTRYLTVAEECGKANLAAAWFHRFAGGFVYAVPQKLLVSSVVKSNARDPANASLWRILLSGESDRP
jgi:hypothetical protein